MKVLKLFLTLNRQVFKFLLFGNMLLKINIYFLSLLLKDVNLFFVLLLKFFRTKKNALCRFFKDDQTAILPLSYKDRESENVSDM